MFEDISLSQEIFLFLFIPGFVIYKIIILRLPIKSIEISKSAPEIVLYGTINYVIFLLVSRCLNFQLDSLWSILFLFVQPIILSLLISQILKQKFVRKEIYDISPTPWDAYFIDEKAKMVMVQYKDNSFVGGIFGENSFASKYPHEKEIFLEKEWLVDSNDQKFIMEIQDSDGIWINCSEIKSIKFFELN